MDEEVREFIKHMLTLMRDTFIGKIHPDKAVFTFNQLIEEIEGL